MMSAMDVMPPAETAALSDNLAVAALALARRFSAGATMWCVAPQWAWHARHVAVEFVHPVIVGKRALPSVHVEGTDPAGALRLLARPGDVLLAVSTADDAPTGDLLRRAEAWGLIRFWLGTGPPPAGRPAEHIVWLESQDPAQASAAGQAGQAGQARDQAARTARAVRAAWAARSGELVLLYHLLWELTQVVFEHPGLVSASGVDAGCTGEVCVTCSDQGDVAEVQNLRPGETAEVVAGGKRREVDISLIEEVAPGDLILIHAGVGISALPRGSQP
jgi:hydrogenase maturation factor